MGINKTLEILEGMWAFAFYNQKTGDLYLCRDRFGEKPLFFKKRMEYIFHQRQNHYLTC